jgi:acetyl esterase/lipase
MSPPKPPRADQPSLVVRYDDHRDGVIDVFLPNERQRERAAPLVVLLHGGFWREQWDRTHLRPMAWALVHEGFVVATPEYRRVGGLGGWPQTAYDVRLGLATVRALIDEAAPDRVDVNAPYVLAGHSAGGHLALWAGQQAGAGFVSHVVALAPVSDLEAAARLRLDEGATQDLLDGEPSEVPFAYAEADPRRLLPDGPRVTILHGDQDQRVPVAMSRSLAESVPSARSRASLTYVELSGTDHFALIDPDSAVWPTVLGALAST